MKRQTGAWMAAHLGRLLTWSACEKLLAQVVSVQAIRISACALACSSDSECHNRMYLSDGLTLVMVEVHECLRVTKQMANLTLVRFSMVH
jgi:hypothetical protein